MIKKLKADYPNMLSLMLMGYEGLDSAVYAINHNLLDQYYFKPIEDIHMFAALVANLLKRYHYTIEEHRRTEQLANAIMQLQEANEQISRMQAAETSSASP